MAQHDPNQPSPTELVPQADPQLGLSEGKAGTTQIVIASIAAVAVIALLFYGLNHQRAENTVNAEAQTTQAAAPPAKPAQPAPAQSQSNPGQAAQPSNAPATTGQGAPQGDQAQGQPK
jgi:hypothetical protein